jgi:hypothetical protein
MSVTQVKYSAAYQASETEVQRKPCRVPRSEGGMSSPGVAVLGPMQSIHQLKTTIYGMASSRESYRWRCALRLKKQLVQNPLNF